MSRFSRRADRGCGGEEVMDAAQMKAAATDASLEMRL
jgi:hypothetical protein